MFVSLSLAYFTFFLFFSLHFTISLSVSSLIHAIPMKIVIGGDSQFYFSNAIGIDKYNEYLTGFQLSCTQNKCIIQQKKVLVSSLFVYLYGVDFAAAKSFTTKTKFLFISH